AAPLAQHGDDEAALGQRDVTDLLAHGGGVSGDLELDDLEALFFECQEVHEAVARHLVLDQAQDQIRRRDGRLDAEQPEVVVVARVVDAGDDAIAEVLLLGDLADEHVVLVVACDRDHEVGALDARALEHPQLGRVAVLHGVLELFLHRQVACARGLDQGDLVVLGDQLAGEVAPHLARPDDDRVHAGYAGSVASARSNISIACLVGEIVCRPCSPYQLARAGSITRTITRSTPKRRCAIWAMIRFVLSPSVEAMNTSARATPACSSASISSAVPTVNWPPESSQLWLWPASRRSWESGSSSSTETSCPSASADLATAEPTRPAPTIITNMARRLDHAQARLSACGRQFRPRLALPVALRRGGHDHPAWGLVDDVLRHVSDEVLEPSPPAPEARAAANPRRFLGAEHYRLHAAPARLVDDRDAGAAGAHRGRRPLH